jgi:Tol biopolymer transport system component
VNADGSGATPLTKLAARSVTSEGPAWSPDGSELTFESDRALDGTDALDTYAMANVWVMNADGSNATPLTKLTIPRAESPVWSSDGSKLAFESNRALDGTDAIIAYGYNIWVLNADGSGATPLTKLTQADCKTPQWNPAIKH